MPETSEFGEEDFLECACPFCGHQLSFPVTYVNTAQSCIACMEVVIVPGDDGKTAKKLPLPLTTPRLQLRRFRPEDWKDVLELGGEDGEALTDEDAVKWIETDGKAKLSEGQYLSLAMELKSSGKVIGWVSIKYYEESRDQASIAMFVNTPFQRQGYATEAVAGILGLGFETLHLHRIAASAYSTETCSCRVFERVGMRREGELVQNHQVAGEWHNTTWYGMLGEEFRAKAKG